jgi:hypothetical protein
MRIKRLSIFALAPLLLVVICAQSALAYSWTSNGGVDWSVALSNTDAHWNQPYVVNQYIDAYAGQYKNWANLFYNGNSVSANIYEYYNGGLAAGGQASGGYLYPGTCSNYITASIYITGYPWPSIPYDNYPSNMGLADTYYFVNGYSASTDWWYNQGVNGRI